MNILIIVAHGSRLKESNNEIINFTKKIQNQCNKNTIVKYAFLELASPSITEVLEKLKVEINKDLKIDVLPYFLAEGRHVKIDIPKEVNEFLLENSTMNISILPHLGKTEGLISLLLNTYDKK